MLLTKHPERKSAYSTSPANVICLLMANTYCCDAFFVHGEVIKSPSVSCKLERGKKLVAAFHSPLAREQRGRTSLGVRLTSVIPSSKSTFVGFSDNRELFVFLVVVVILFIFVIIVIIVCVCFAAVKLSSRVILRRY